MFSSFLSIHGTQQQKSVCQSGDMFYPFVWPFFNRFYFLCFHLFLSLSTERCKVVRDFLQMELEVLPCWHAKKSHTQNPVSVHVHMCKWEIWRDVKVRRQGPECEQMEYMKKKKKRKCARGLVDTIERWESGAQLTKKFVLCPTNKKGRRTEEC